MNFVFTPEQQIANCRLALRLWQERVTPGMVVPMLDTWHCGTQACFGGHLAQWPEFQAMGVMQGPGNAPYVPYALDDGVDLSAYQIAERLFGDRTAFKTRGYGQYDEGAGVQSNLRIGVACMRSGDISDYGLVVHRLEQQIKRLEWQIENETKPER